MLKQIKKKYLWLGIVPILFLSCWRSKKDYKFTINLKNTKAEGGCQINLYQEYYRYFSSYMATDINSVYLTDSASFRKYLGKYDEDGERIWTECKGDLLIVSKSVPTSNAAEWNIPRLVEKKYYSLKKLKERNSYDW